jgi:GT2 family glycosyltransferase
VDAVIRPWVVRRKCIDAVGALDESFRPSEWDESDLCYRIRRAGWKIATHGYERTGAYTHLGSTTLRFSDAYKAKVLRNGQLFYSRWDETILREHTRVYRTWWRCGSWASWRWTLRRMANLVFGKLSRSSPVCRKPGKSA